MVAASVTHQQRFGIGPNAGGVSTREFFIESNGIVKTPSQIQNEGMYGSRDYKSESTTDGTYAVGGVVPLKPRPDDLTFLMPYILGGAASVNNFAVAEALPEMVCDSYRISETVRKLKCKVNTATFSSRAGQQLNLDLDIQGTSWTPGITFPSIASSLSVQAPFMHHQCVLTIGGTAYKVDDVTLTIGNNLILDRFYNSQYRQDLPEGSRTVGLSCTFPFTSDESAIYAMATAGLAASIVWTSGLYSLTFTFAKLQAAIAAPSLGGRSSEVKLPVNFVARASGSTPSIAATVVST